MTASTTDWADRMMDALRSSDDGNNPFYADDGDTVSLAMQLAEAVVGHLAADAAATVHLNPAAECHDGHLIAPAVQP